MPHRIRVAATAAIILISTVVVRADYTPVYGGPTMDFVTGNGFQLPGVADVAQGSNFAGNGVTVGYFYEYVNHHFSDVRAFEWGPAGLTELSSLNSSSESAAINSAGIAVGDVSTSTADYPATWDTTGNVQPLGVLGLSSFGYTDVHGTATINSTGMVLATVEKYINGQYSGIRAVLWNANSTTPIELGVPNIPNADRVDTYSAAINSSGTVVGSAVPVINEEDGFSTPVRWDAGNLSPVQLDIPSGYMIASAYNLNSSGVAIGVVSSSDPENPIVNAVRWAAKGTAATVLGNLGVSKTGSTNTAPNAINDAGTIAGYSEKYVNGVDLGQRAVRWDASGTAATELGVLGTDNGISDINQVGWTKTYASAINSAGLIAGYAERYDSNGNYYTTSAVVWGTDGVPLDLNTLIDPNSGWILTNATGISDTDWVTGIGYYDPDGSGPLQGYNRGFLIQIPEPSSLGLTELIAFSLLLRVRRDLSFSSR